MKRLVIDLDNTIAGEKTNSYADCAVRTEVVEKLREYKERGFEIVIFTARNMRTYENNLGKIAANTSPVIIEWLEKNNVPFDELWIGKPWCGTDGFYVDDKAIRPDEFVKLSLQEIHNLIGSSVSGNE
ncbi:MAG: HAD-IIIC family phosphatase [Alphaproteobacteria bacterium]|nr:HAD-IIIC family phosphatase [Alphaproteobacteria bacterium]